MNSDIRISVTLWEHPKTIRLQERCGSKGVLCLLKLWTWTALNRPDGVLAGMTRRDIERAVGWRGKRDTFYDALYDLRWLDINEDGEPVVHGWRPFQTWASMDAERGNRARYQRLAQVDKAAFDLARKDGKRSLTADDYMKYRLAATLVPAASHGSTATTTATATAPPCSEKKGVRPPRPAGGEMRDYTRKLHDDPFFGGENHGEK